jgi:transposase-like protein
MVMAKKAGDEGKTDGGLESSEGARRGRPGRRSVAERTQAVLELISGKASVDQLAKRYGVLPATVVNWRDEGIAGIEAALRQGEGGSPRERELEQRLAEMEETLREVSLKYALASRGVEEWKSTARPTRRRRSPK